MADLIDRQAAIEIVSKWLGDVFGVYQTGDSIGVFKRLRKLPSAQPERERGRWGYQRHDHKWTPVCTACFNFADKATDFCPNCGASMQSTDDYDDIDWLANDKGKFDDMKGEQE